MTSDRSTSHSDSAITSTDRDRRRLIAAGIVLGIGQAGFFDGIVLHQLLQWHHMFSSIASDRTVAGLELNTLGDGFFHLFDWLITLVGIVLLWQAANQSSTRSVPTLVGAVLLGFGLFNLVEGIVDHQILGIHHVRTGPHTLTYDIAFLVISLVIASVGWLILGRIKPDEIS